MRSATQTVLCLLLSVAVDWAVAQMTGDKQRDQPPNITIQECVEGGECTARSVKLTLDERWRPNHDIDGDAPCMNDSGFWDESICPDGKTCAKRCALEGVTAAGYADSGISTTLNGTGVKLQYVKGPRLYFLDGDSPDKYMIFKLKNKEFTFDVDVSQLPCGTETAIYLIEMDERGGRSDAGAKLGAGYCDAQCPGWTRFIDNEAIVEDWEYHWAMSPEYKQVKVGPQGESSGACCAEMDIFEGNRMATAITPHPCGIKGLKKCKGEKECGNKTVGEPGFCDKNGCGFNSYLMGARDFYGAGENFTIDTTKPFTVVTQFVTHDGTDNGHLIEIKRIWVQDGKVINNSVASILDEADQANSITDAFCSAATKKFNEGFNKTKMWNISEGGAFKDTFGFQGGLKSMGDALGRGMVFSMSVWDDSLQRMLWLDAEKDLVDEDPKVPGSSRGPCEFSSGDVEKLHKDNPKAYVTMSNVKIGPLGSTFSKGEASVPLALREFQVSPRVAAAPRGAGPAAALALPAAAALLAAAAVAAKALTASARRARQLVAADEEAADALCME